MSKLWQFLGFDGDDYADEDDGPQYEEERPKKSKSARKDDSRGNVESPRLVFFKGVPSEDIKLKLRDAMYEGAMILLDLQGLERERLTDANNFINFMEGVAFAQRGVMERIGAALFVVTPRKGMLQWWAGEE